MIGLRFDAKAVVVAITGFSLTIALAMPALGQSKASGKKSTSRKSSQGKSRSRTKAADRDATATDAVKLRDGKILLGLVDMESAAHSLVVVARREWIREHLPEWAETWKVAERVSTATALSQRRNRLAEWRKERPSSDRQEDRINAWLDRQLSQEPGILAPSPLMIVRLGEADVASVQRKGVTTARALRSAWVLGLKDPETTTLASLEDAIGRRSDSLD